MDQPPSGGEYLHTRGEIETRLLTPDRFKRIVEMCRDCVFRRGHDVEPNRFYPHGYKVYCSGLSEEDRTPRVDLGFSSQEGVEEFTKQASCEPMVLPVRYLPTR